MKLSILIAKLKEYDEVQILELLDVSSEDLVEMFSHKIRERRAYITKEMELEEGPEGDDDNYNAIDDE